MYYAKLKKPDSEGYSYRFHVENILKKYPDIRIAGKRNGYFDDSTEIINNINETKPDFLFVCLGAPKQERFMKNHREELDVKLMAGLGGSLDVFAGHVSRAPVSWQKLGLEWLYRLIKQPSRIGRMMRLPVFLLRVIKKRVMK